MTTFKGKTFWLVGAGAGLGAALARQMSAAGAGLILTSRSESDLRALADELPGPVQVAPADVADAASLAQAAERIGAVDGLVFVAGVYWPMRAQDWDAEKAVAMADINFTGLVRVLGHVVPDMVARDRGHIVVVGSLSGFRGLPGAAGYAAAKAGAMALTEGLYADLRGTGVKVQLANPGYIRTRLTDKNTFKMPYIMEPDAAADVLMKHMRSSRFQRSFPAPFSWLFRASVLLPDWLYFRIF